jgi:hypothetical protein
MSTKHGYEHCGLCRLLDRAAIELIEWQNPSRPEWPEPSRTRVESVIRLAYERHRGIVGRETLARKMVGLVYGDVEATNWHDVRSDGRLLAALRAIRAVDCRLRRQPERVEHWLSLSMRELRAVAEDEALLLALGDDDGD